MRRGFWFSIIASIIFCAPALAYDWSTNPGNGDPNNPFQINDPNQLNSIGTDPNLLDKSFILVNDIDMSDFTGSQYNIIGNLTTQFTGTFDGKGYKISNLSYITTSPIDYTGLFGHTNNAIIENLGIENATFSTVGKYIGGLIGYQNSGILNHCFSIGSSIISTPSSYSVSRVGGLVGHQDSGSITSCYSTGSVGASSIAEYSGTYLGGIVGYQNSGTVSHCYSMVSANASPSRFSIAGGLVGHQDSGSISQCYSTGAVTTSSFSASSYTGGLVGRQVSGIITSCYSTGAVNSSSSNAYSSCYVGGLIGSQTDGSVICCFSKGTITTSGSGNKIDGGLIATGDGNTINCFWDEQTSGLDYSAGGNGRTTIQMKQSANYKGWDTPVQNYWTIDEGVDYPHLMWENLTGDPLPEQALTDYITGAGTENNPYQIYTAEQFNIIGLFPDEWHRVFCLKQDIDLSIFTGTEFNRIGVNSAKCFSGIFNGNGYIIRNPSYTTTTTIKYVSLFGYIDNAVIKNTSIENANFSNGNYTGGLVGYQNSGTISDCNSLGIVNASSSSSSSYSGGLVAYQNSGIIRHCYNSGDVKNTCLSISPDISCTGGLVGYQNSGSISHSHATAAVIASSEYYASFAGGLVGFQNSGTIRNCSSAGSAKAYTDISDAGGLVGIQKDSGIISHCFSSASATAISDYSSAGGLAGQSHGIIMNCYSIGSVIASSGDSCAGGLVGRQFSGSISGCYSTGDAKASTFYSRSSAGGLVGYQMYENTIISNCYCTGSASVYSGSSTYYSNVGGLVGRQSNYNAKVANCYSTGQVLATAPSVRKGGLLGNGNYEIVACYWDTETSEITDGVGNLDPDPSTINGLDDPNMMIQANFVDWDFVGESTNGENEIWRMCANGEDYPRLSWKFAQNGDLACPDGIGIEDIEMLSQCWLTNTDIPTELDDDGDNVVGMVEMALLGQYWLQIDCDNCGGIDITGDGDVLADDLMEIANDWLRTVYPSYITCDANGDEKIDLADFAVLGANW